MAKKILSDPMEVSIAVNKPAEKIIQQAYIVYEPQKIPLVLHLLQEKKSNMALIFCSSKISVKQLTSELKRKGIKAGEIHSDLEQSERENIIMQYKSGKLPVLVATDILSRGIDIDNIDLVINFDVPHDAEDYVHRIGRTARAAASGGACTLVSLKEQGKFQTIEKFLGKEVEKINVSAFIGEQPIYDPALNKASHYKKGKSKRR